MRVAPKVSVIVPAHNSEHRIGRLLGHLERQTAPAGTFEVIVVDDCSTDGTFGVADASPIARALRAPRRGGPYPARNMGRAAARGSILAFTDADCEPDPTWIEAGLRALGETGADLIAGHIEVPLGANPTIPSLVDYARRYLDQEFLVENGFGATANLWIRASIFDRVGGFNERLLSGGDHELGTRAVAAGAKLLYRPDVLVVHEPRRRARELARKQFRLGYGAAQHLYFAEGPLRNRPHVALHPGAYLPDRRLGGVGRLDALGRRPGRVKYLAMLAVNYACWQLPSVAGNIAGTLQQRRLPPRAAT